MIILRSVGLYALISSFDTTWISRGDREVSEGEEGGEDYVTASFRDDLYCHALQSVPRVDRVLLAIA